jgi:N-carbamoyl-L-amino-acid hydrolase
VGRYLAATPGAKTLLTGSHYDTVRNGGKYDGRLGIFTPMACVRELSRQGKRLPFDFEVVAFSEEEGQRYKATFLGSGSLIGGQFNSRWLDQQDADGITMRDAMQNAGLRIEDIPGSSATAQVSGLCRSAYRAGPVLNELDMPLGVVTSINGSVRYAGRGHRHRLPRRHHPDGPAQRRGRGRGRAGPLAAERRAARTATRSPPSASCWCPAAPSMWCRGAASSRWTCAHPPTAAQCPGEATSWPNWQAICERRQVRYTLEETMRAAPHPATPNGRRAGSARSTPWACHCTACPAAPATTP